MKSKTMNRGLTLGALLISQGIFIQAGHATIPLTTDCKSSVAGSLTEFFTCGSISGSLRTLYYSTHNAWRGEQHQLWRAVQYETSPVSGVDAEL